MHSLDIRFDESDTAIDNVVVAIAPIDAFTGQYVRGDLRISIEGLLNIPVINLTGMYVFVNLPPQAKYVINIETEKVGYFNPDSIEFIPPDNDDPDRVKKRRLDVLLFRRPTAPVEPDTTSVAGVVVRPDMTTPANQIPVSLAVIRAEFPEDLLPPGTNQRAQFKTFSDERGAFLLAMRLPVDAVMEPVTVRFIFEKIQNGQIDKRVIERQIKDQVFYSFAMPVDIEAPDIPLALNGVGIPGLIDVAK